MILISTLLIISGFLGLIISLIILIKQKSNRLMNIYFIVFLFTISVKQLAIGICSILIKKDLMEDYLLDLSNFSVLGLPIIYLYIKKLSTGDNYFDRKEFIKFLSITSTILFSILYVINFEFNILNTQYEFVIYLTPFLFSAFYTYLCFEILSKEIWSKKNKLITKNQNELISSWSKFIFVAILISPLKFLTILLLNINEKSIVPIYSFQVILSIMIIIICIKILCYPEILYGYNMLTEKVNENRKTKLILNQVWDLSSKTIPKSIQEKKLKDKIDSNILMYIEQIEKLAFDNDLLYMADITIGEFANKLAIPKSHLVFLFKYHSSVSFIEFKKIIRIQYATKLIKDDFLKTSTLNSLSKKVGFSSYDPFYRSFKDITGNSPVDYYNFVQMNKMYY